ncbi:adenylate/guanylate cyclase domain-containing protein [Reyranella sp.]|uniref:adenylate/guanylate cyclase domain-containing protein n=1 Tax=Reyranella sp. TaxID=1929291 RepID=UPI00272FB0E7|nr:adenylate/guanylate cyclase domain-containing protein [Reyranella sp.]MDP2373591.1 adenylate/guanylate cyclase domain-containing protein [Reyranella sp.]
MTGERVVRRLAAILAADVAGYSRLMGRDENGTLSRLRAHRTERLEPTLARHGGRLVKLTGDGALIEFPSAVDALGAAIEFQQAMAEVNRDQPEETAIVFRIGLHLGDLIVEGDDLYGDGVNVAARLEAEAPPGGIVISYSVRDAVAGRLKATFDDLGSLALKNIDRPVQGFGVKWEAADWKVKAPSAIAPPVAPPPATVVPLALPHKPSIAVLPFQNMSGDPEQEYFADGLVEDIITALSNFKSLFVIARNSSFTYKGKAVDVKQVGRELGVRYVLEGSVRKAGGKVRITGQLIDSETGAHLWAGRFDGPLDDVFELQDQVTTSVVGAIAPKVDQAEAERAKRKPAENLDAYDFYLRGRAKLQEDGREALEEAIRLFYRAVELDPHFAAPYAAAAGCYVTGSVQGWVRDREWEVAETRRLAMRASALGGDDALALALAGQALVVVCREFDTGAALIDKALAINPNLAAGWQRRGLVSLWLGQHDAALEQFARALRLSPLDPGLFLSEGYIGMVHLFRGRYDEALSWIARALAQRPNFVVVLRAAAVANAFAGNIDEARKIVARIIQISPTASISHYMSINIYQRPEDIERMVGGLRLAGMPE